jgi:C-terminal processing protease CtpA/Prc
MVGRLRADKETGKDKLLIEGSGTATSFDALLEAVNAKTRYGFKLSKKAGGAGPSDHASFVEKKIPVLFCWTDYHDDYHRQTDTADKINVKGMNKVVNFAQEIITVLETGSRPEFVEVKSKSGPTSPGMSGPRLGIRPSYSDDEEDKGVLLAGVSPDLPAQKAGLKEGDRIIEIAGKPVKNLETYMQVMGAQKPGGVLELLIVRDGKKMPVKVKLD